MAGNGKWKLKLKFKDAEGKAVQFTYPYINPLLSASTARSLMETIIARAPNLFEKVPVDIVSSSLVYSEERACTSSSSTTD